MFYNRMAGHRDLADRLTECVYEVVDRLSFFLTSQKPDHKQGQHFVFPDISDGIIVPPELTKNARQKLQQLPNKQFEDLVMDVYDEIDRRETEASEFFLFFNFIQGFLFSCIKFIAIFEQ